jgi:hypothetical protein
MICLLSLILPFDPLHQPSTTTSITAMATGDTPGSMKPGDMIVSVTRHKNSIKEQAGFADLNKMLEARLAVSLDDLSIGRSQRQRFADCCYPGPPKRRQTCGPVVCCQELW